MLLYAHGWNIDAVAARGARVERGRSRLEGDGRRRAGPAVAYGRGDHGKPAASGSTQPILAWGEASVAAV